MKYQAILPDATVINFGFICECKRISDARLEQLLHIKNNMPDYYLIKEVLNKDLFCWELGFDAETTEKVNELMAAKGYSPHLIRFLQSDGRFTPPGGLLYTIDAYQDAMFARAILGILALSVVILLLSKHERKLETYFKTMATSIRQAAIADASWDTDKVRSVFFTTLVLLENIAGCEFKEVD